MVVGAVDGLENKGYKVIVRLTTAFCNKIF